jgi:Na+/H+ antiporter NhaB
LGGRDQRRRWVLRHYHRVASARPDDNDILDGHIDQHYREVLEQFRGFCAA